MLFRDLVKNRPVLVLGSAPCASLEDYQPQDILLCINGSQNLNRELVPDVLLVNGMKLKRKSDNARVTMSLFRGLRAKHLVCITNTLAMPAMCAALRDAGLEWNTDEELSKEERQRIVERALARTLASANGKDVASTGMTAALWAKECGARSVRISGITLQGGHFYMPGDTARGHTDVDRECFAVCGLAESSPLKIQRIR